MVHRLFLIGLLLVLAPIGSLAASTTGQMMPGNIAVSECVPNEGVPSQQWMGPWGRMYEQTGTPSTLTIHYANESPKTAKSIEFGLLANNRMIAAVRDKGTFSSGAAIKHVFGVSPNIFPIGTSFTFCVPLRIKYADGSVWTNPKAPSV